MNGNSLKRPAIGEQSSVKKARFDYRNPSTLAADAPEEDIILELDEIGKGGLQAKRNAVKLEGYESDSSNENFDARAEAKAQGAKREKRPQQKSKDEDDNDMFADLEEEQFNDADEDEDLSREGKKKKKEVRFMNETEIQGQVSNSMSGGHVSADFSLGDDRKQNSREAESSSDDSGDDEERDRIGDEVDEELGAGSKKKHAPKLDAFNMRDEAEEGKFDDTGNFVRKATDPMAVHDSWLEGATKADVKRAAEAHEKREIARRERDMADDALVTSDILGALISRLELAETVLEALARLGKPKEKKKQQLQRNKRKGKAGKDVDMEMADDNPAEARRRDAVVAITAAADQLMTRGQTDIYDTEREALVRQYRRETGEDWVDAPERQSKEWEYRWSDARDGGENHGPYDGPTMAAWNEAGYFGEGVEFRRIGTNTWSQSVDFDQS